MARGGETLQEVDVYESESESSQWVLVPAGTDLAKVTGLPASKGWKKQRAFKLDGTVRVATPKDEEIRAAIATKGFCAFKSMTVFIEPR